MTGRLLMFSTIKLLSVVVAVLAINGCSSSKTEDVGMISGKLTLNGEPFISSKVSIYNSELLVRRAANVKSGGNFEMKQIPPGDYSVIVLSKPLEDEAEFLRVKKMIPAKLRSHDSSDLSVTVKVDEDTKLNIELAP